MYVINKCGTEIDFYAATNLMVDEIREKLAFEFAPCTDQEFFTAYEIAYEKEYNTEWELSKSNPCW